MKKLFVMLIIIASLTVYFAGFSSAAEQIYVFDDWERYNVILTKDKAQENYFADGVVNFRCAYSSWDSSQEYLWLISDWERAARQPASLYIDFDFDMSNVKYLAFDYVTDTAQSLEGNKVYFTADSEGTQIIAQAFPSIATGVLKNPETQEMEILDTTYKGPLYLHVTYQVRMFVGNFQIISEVEDQPTQVPATEAPATQAPATNVPATQAPATNVPATQAPDVTPEENKGCGGSSAIAQVMLIIAAAVIVKKKK